ncbi:hypothetical protein VNI00_010498 [Paramarasmius palmivorus]|uniref:Polymerase nucleotidyl transferase domain-containing protein n=1 Tax=Paramarasmius palmivorus TaxID=297713 RepID=A0AAW0CGZ1_9AGAR
MKGPSNAKQVRKAAREAVQALADNNIKCCLFGSAACHIYGMQNRVPGDVDIVLLTNDGRDIEYIKQLVVSRNPTRFFLEESIYPNKTYKKLYYRLGNGRRCKVDVLHPGRASKLKIPTIHKRLVEYPEPYGDIPVMPILPLLLMKLKGWVDHRRSSKPYEQKKVGQDVGDIDGLLEIVVDEYGVEMDSEGSWLPRKFVRASKKRVGEYVNKFPRSAQRWRKIGFDV